MANKTPKGIGGWLILPTIGMFLAALIYVVLALVYSVVMCINFTATYAMMFVISVIMSVLVIYAIVLELKKKKAFPKAFIAVMWIGVGLGIVMSLIDGDFSSIMRDSVSSALWTLYMVKSKRVKNTFVK
ncbi:DUF2569 domain-containing protein [Candidatus Woesearchaeota archaeon]|nr:DUF2569 domain-containing protein [Candidatus Woesearchaeota archaeon]